MNTQEALEFLQEAYDDTPADYISVSCWRGRLAEAIETLHKAVEWQPMETAPIDIPNNKRFLWRFKKPSPDRCYYAGAGDAHLMWGLESFNGWKEVE